MPRETNHAAEARRLLREGTKAGKHPTQIQEAQTHALLAIQEELEALRGVLGAGRVQQSAIPEEDYH